MDYIPYAFAQSTTVPSNITEDECYGEIVCKPGLVLPVWQPQGNLSVGDKVARATVYFVSLVYMFLGVSIVSDRFMASIEVITSKEKEVLIRRSDGSTTTVNVRIWNETVSNLTLMALGSSAPEILLSVIEICKEKFEAGDLGPSTISEGDTELRDGKANHVDEVVFKGLDSVDTEYKEVKEFEQHRKDFMEILRELRKKNPNTDMKTLEEMAELEAINRGPKSRAFYRIQATRKLTGGGNVIKKQKIERRASLDDVKVDVKDDSVTKVYFDPGHYTVMENVGTFSLTVTREGVTIIDDEIFEEDEHFYVRLSNIRLGDSQGMFENSQIHGQAKLSTPHVATVMILDDDHPGIFHFEEKEMSVPEAIGEMHVKVTRTSGARGMVKIPYHTVDGTAKSGKDFELFAGEVVFDNDETE
ncbi:hypothetical protein KUTeg_014424 [Tegillarca granosa]|uniref:Calx-beta domain-containing protein n=1 Tax=Tegillarca granosa TaxID=220873 RepID=A0ABQ9F0A3_TEGGR|nr:hypothetical protein KUTeg_014424 [Tegillarca granosa]